MPAGTYASQVLMTVRPAILSSFLEMPLPFILARVRLASSGSSPGSNAMSSSSSTHHLVDPPVRQIEDDVEDFQLVVRPRT
jgi:hypothetical protein